MKTSDEADPEGRPEPLTLSVPDAGAMAGLAKNASYRAAKRGEIPTIKLGGIRRVPNAKWRRILAQGPDPSDAD